MYELGGVMAAAGEELALAITAEYELMCWDLQSAVDAVDVVEREMARRVLAEVEGAYVLGVGHALANTVGRALALDPALRPNLEKEVSTAFPPSSDMKKDWISLSRVPGLLRVATEANAPDLLLLVQILSRLRTESAWECLEQSRAEDFHRWRPQSAGIVGAARGSFGRIQDDGSRVYEFGTDRVIGRNLPAKLADTVRDTARAALDLLPDALSGLDAARVPVIERLTAWEFRG